MAEFDLVSLLLPLIVERVAACIGLGFGAGIVCNMLSVVGIIGAGHFEVCGLVLSAVEVVLNLGIDGR